MCINKPLNDHMILIHIHLLDIFFLSIISLKHKYCFYFQIFQKTNRIQMDSKTYEKILNEFEKSNSDIGELIRLQEELSNCENELVAFQIRFVHK